MDFPMDDIAQAGRALHSGMLEMIADGLSAGLMVYDATDNLLFASRRVEQLLKVEPKFLAIGSNLRNLFGADYDCRKESDPEFALNKHNIDRDAWISENLAAHWKERSETEDCFPGNRWLRFARRRMAGGMGLCVISDVSEQKRSEKQWRFDIERVQVIEEILDSLSFPITVTDQNHIYVGANKAAAAFMQRPVDAIVGRNVADHYVSALAQRIISDNERVLETGVAVNVPERIAMPSGVEELFVTHKMRVGKPGMYFVLTCMEEVTSFAKAGHDGKLALPGLEQLEFVRSPDGRGIKHTSMKVAAPKVLVVCEHEQLARFAKRRLNTCGMEADYVLSKSQLSAVLAVCKSDRLKIDIILVSEEFGPEVLAQIDAHGLCGEPISRREIEASVTDIVCTTLNVRCKQCRSDEPGARKLKDCSLCELKFQDQDRVDVLVAEDNPINQVVFSQVLDSLKLRYRICPTAAELLAMAATCNPSVIFMDTTLPDMDGFAATLVLRANEAASGSKRTPVVGVVALAFEGDKQKCYDFGMDDMLLKPLSPDMVDLVFRKFSHNSAKLAI